MAKTYLNIPVSPETYRKVSLISEAKGRGVRGLGAQITEWADRELPECDHEKQSVNIEYFPTADANLAESINFVRTGWYCAICNRVYAKVEQS